MMNAAMAKAIDVEPRSEGLLCIVSAPGIFRGPYCFGPSIQLRILGPDETDLTYLNGASYTSVGEFQEAFFNN